MPEDGMFGTIRRETPLHEFNAAEVGRDQVGACAPVNSGSAATPAAGGVQLRERPFLGHLNLRGDPTDEAFRGAVREVLGIGLPLEPNSVAADPEATALWLGPDEWLLLTPPEQKAGIAQGLEDACVGTFAAVTDVSGGQTVINVRGHRARDVLSKGSPVDFHPRAFGAGRCAQTHLAKAMVIVGQLDESPSFDIIVRRSFADYLARWLKDAAREYGVLVVEPSSG